MKFISCLLILTSVLTLKSTDINAQCSGGNLFVSVTAPTSGSVMMSSCNWAGDYNTINSVVAGTEYTLTSTGGCMTVRTGSSTGPLVTFGNSPLTFTAPSSGTYYVIFGHNCVTCGTGSPCLETSIAATSGGGGGTPCDDIQTIGGCGQGHSLTLGGTGSFNSSFCSWSVPGNEMIYQYTATSTGTYSINVSNITGFDWIDIGWKLASAGCSETGWNCIDDVNSTGTYGSMSWTAGETYYLIFDVEGTGTNSIDFSLVCPAGGPVTAGDCPDAVAICSNASFSISPNGFGAVNEINTSMGVSNPQFLNATGANAIMAGTGNDGCLRSGELNSTWMIINILTAGTLEFSFGSYNWLGNFFDWAMWPYTGASTCTQITSNSLAPVRCNWNGTGISFTGIATAANVNAYQTLYSDFLINTNFAPELVVTANSQYIICFSNWSSALTTVPLNFFGTADISCSPLGNSLINLSGIAEENQNTLNWLVANEIKPLYYAVERRLDDGTFAEIAQIELQEQQQNLKQYTFNDEEPVNGINYYRIKQVNENGQTVYSEIIALEQDIEELSILSYYPNPTTDDLTLKFSSVGSGNVQVQIVNLVGSQVLTSEITPINGISVERINTRALASGTYLLVLKDLQTNKAQTIRFVKE